jgi:hypothetical protein
MAITHAGRRALAVLNDRHRRQIGWKHRRRNGYRAERTMGRIVGMLGRCLIGRSRRSARFRQAMLVKQARRGFCAPLRAQNTGQQRIENKRVRNDAANKAAP